MGWEWLDQASASAGEALAGQARQGFDQLEVVLRGNDGHVSHVDGEEWELGLDIFTGAVPAKQSMYGEGVTDVIPPWERWEIRFSTEGIDIYARQLDHFDIELGALGGGFQTIDYAHNLAQAKPSRRTGKPEEEKRIRGFTFLSAKPILLVVNVGDRDVSKIAHVIEAFDLQQLVSKRKVGITAVSGKVESEIAALEPEDARLFMEEFGISGRALDRIIQKSYDLLGVFSFFTAAEPEVQVSPARQDRSC